MSNELTIGKSRAGAYPFKGLTKHQKKIMDEIGVGNYSLAYIFPKKAALDDLVAKGLIEPCGQQRYGKGALSISIPEFQMPIGVHAIWCKYQSNEYDKNPRK